MRTTFISLLTIIQFVGIPITILLRYFVSGHLRRFHYQGAPIFATKQLSSYSRSWVFLEVELELVVCVVELVNPDVAVLSATRVARAVRVERDRVDGTEVTLHATKLLLKH